MRWSDGVSFSLRYCSASYSRIVLLVTPFPVVLRNCWLLPASKVLLRPNCWWSLYGLSSLTCFGEGLSKEKGLESFWVVVDCDPKNCINSNTYLYDWFHWDVWRAFWDDDLEVRSKRTDASCNHTHSKVWRSTSGSSPGSPQMRGSHSTHHTDLWGLAETLIKANIRKMRCIHLLFWSIFLIIND